MAKHKTLNLQWNTGDGKSIPVFVREIQGGSPGPTLALVGAEHGIELAGAAAIDAVCRELETQWFSGTVLAVPTIAPINITYRHHTYGQPRDRGYTLDMPYNSYARWPGNPDGDPADRLCALIWQEVIERADAVFNLHAWGLSASCVLSRLDAEGVGTLARDFGIPFRVSVKSKRTLADAAIAHGKPAALVEFFGQYYIHPVSFQRGCQGIYNIMASLGMIDRPIVRAKQQFVVGGKDAEIHAPVPGIFVPLAPLETLVKEGDLLGYLLDINTGARTDIRSPFDGATWLISRVGHNADAVIEGLHAYAEQGELIALVREVLELNEW